MTRNARRRRRCGARIEMRERAPSVDIHVHVRAEVLGELANAEICAAAGDRGGEIEPAFHERVALACADDVRGAADGARRDAARGGGARAIARRDAGRDAHGGVGGGEGGHLERRVGWYDAGYPRSTLVVVTCAAATPRRCWLASQHTARDEDIAMGSVNQETTSRKRQSSTLSSSAFRWQALRGTRARRGASHTRDERAVRARGPGSIVLVSGSKLFDRRSAGLASASRRVVAKGTRTLARVELGKDQSSALGLLAARTGERLEG